MAYQIKKLPKSTIAITATIEWKKIEDQYSKAFKKLQSELEVEGFRKGKVPESIAKKHLERSRVYEEAIREMLPTIYQDIVTKEKLKPVITPKIELASAKENEDWKVVITVAEKPSVELGDYKKKIKALKADRKKDNIWVPGKDDKKIPDPKDNEVQQQLLNDILSLLLKETKAEISDLILEDEVQKRLANLVDHVQKIGLTMEAYLQSKGTSAEEIKKQYEREIEETYKLEFVLAEIADAEKLKVENEDLDKLFGTIKNEQEKAQAQANAYFYASLLRKQKTLDFLTNL